MARKCSFQVQKMDGVGRAIGEKRRAQNVHFMYWKLRGCGPLLHSNAKAVGKVD